MRWKISRGSYDGVRRAAKDVNQKNEGVLLVTSNKQKVSAGEESGPAVDAMLSRHCFLTFSTPSYDDVEDDPEQEDVYTQFTTLKGIASGMLPLFDEILKDDNGNLERGPFLDMSELVHKAWGKKRVRGLKNYIMLLTYNVHILCVAQAPKEMYEKAFSLVMKEASMMVQISNASTALETFILTFFKAREAGQRGANLLGPFPLDTRVFRRDIRPPLYQGAF